MLRWLSDFETPKSIGPEMRFAGLCRTTCVLCCVCVFLCTSRVRTVESADASAATSADGWWSFSAPRRPRPPESTNISLAQNPIDEFVHGRLAVEHLQPAPRADRATLIRRLSLDLLGLPPSPADLDLFLADESPDAYQRLVDRLLASPHYGERWGRHWLDGARYADSSGGEMDMAQPMWQYRDWVVDALNRDLPYDRFVIEQLAGDLLPEARESTFIATGFHRCCVYDRLAGNGSDEVARLQSVTDRVNTTGSVLLGLTLACAQCHTHKFDPVSIDEYYQLFAFFNDADDVYLGFSNKRSLDQYRAARAQVKALEEELVAYESKLAGPAGRWEINLDEAERAQLPGDVQAALAIGKEAGTEEQSALVFSVFKAQDAGFVQRRTLIDQLDTATADIDLIPVMHQREGGRDTHVFLRGDVNSPGDAVAPDVPRFLPKLAMSNQTNRLDLAHWIVHPRHPLTWRVAVNRVWQQSFGQGLVATENDFGTRGALPTHPELLDWLACEFVELGGSLKSLHRLIISSATYQQSSRPREELAQRDAGNRWLARQSRLRIEAEVVRDATLEVGGILSHKLGGPSVYPFQNDGVLEGRATPVEWKQSEGEDRFRRGLYTYVWRLTPHPFLRTFDAPEAITTCTRRYRSNTPLQALTLLNDPTFVDAARGMAQRILMDTGESDKQRLHEAHRVGLARTPSETEMELL